MEKELSDTIAAVEAIASNSKSESRHIRDWLEGKTHLLFFGCGGALIAAEATAYWVNESSRLFAYAAPSSEVPRLFGIEKDLNGFAAFAISQSGETMETVKACSHLQSLGVRVAAILNNVSSQMARECASVIPCYSGIEVAVASTKAFIAQLCRGAMFVNELRQVDNRRWLDELKKALQFVYNHRRSHLRTIASNLRSKSSIIITGFGAGFYAAQELALKLKEIGYIHAEAIHSAEFKHGPLALLDQDTDVIFIAVNQEASKLYHIYSQEILARGARMTVVGNVELSSKPSDSISAVDFPTLDAMGSTIVAAYMGEWLAFYVAEMRGNPIDQPRNLAKSVTVA
jgi:glucosamine--fructose-6-phosphate aminotransferase (isomerizing)